MKAIKGSIAALMAACACACANASQWNTFSAAYSDEALFFFDADTVVKQGDTVTIWMKYVKTKVADSDGSWATAQRVQIFCSRRQTLTTAMSIYDQDNKFMRTLSTSGAIKEITPDSVMEGVHKASCAADFPRSKDRTLYYPVKDNDVFAHARSWLEYLKTQQDTAPK